MCCTIWSLSVNLTVSCWPAGRSSFSPGLITSVLGCASVTFVPAATIPGIGSRVAPTGIP